MERVIKGLIISGPTGVGKTELAVQISRRLGGEILSCDSVQVYRHLNIGANKTASGDTSQHLIDIVEPSRADPFTAAEFYNACQLKIKEVVGRKNVPILVGGTGFYLEWILRGRPAAPPSDPAIAAQVDVELEPCKLWSEKLAILEAVDPVTARRLYPNDIYRLKRALVVYRATGKPLSSYERYPSSQDSDLMSLLNNDNVDWRCIYLTGDREIIARRIDERCELMIDQGLLEEVHRLILDGHLIPNSPAARAIGYAETIEFFKRLKLLNLEKFSLFEKEFLAYLEGFMGTTRKYSRRQELWFKRASEFKWVDKFAHANVMILADTICQWFWLDKAAYQEATLASDGQTRLRIIGNPDENRRQRRTYTSQLKIFGDRDKLSELHTRTRQLGPVMELVPKA